MNDDYEVHKIVHEQVGSISSDEVLTDLDRTILAFVRDHPGCAYYELTEQFRIGESHLNHALLLLISRNLIVFKQRPTKWLSEQKCYFLASTFYPT